jgi:hypothetical protein
MENYNDIHCIVHLAKNCIQYMLLQQVLKKRKMIILAQGFRGFNPWFLDTLALGLWQDRTSCGSKQ